MHRFDQPRRLLAYAIAGLAGFVDATGFLEADRYFVSFMSGNTTRLGVDLATNSARAFAPALLILGFVCGVTCGALVAERTGARRKTAVIALAGGLLVGAALARLAGSTEAFLACSVLAMGVLNNAFRRDGEVAVGLTYMTGALVRFGQGLAARLNGSALPGWSTSLILWLSLAVGAMLGAVAFTRAPDHSAGISALLGIVLLAAAWRVERAYPSP
jgi:uncharacterized membrane protein YoaK (UPF0700 family)